MPRKGGGIHIKAESDHENNICCKGPLNVLKKANKFFDK